MKTRSHARRTHSSYRRHRRNSHCHKKGRATCRTTPGCKYTSGKRQYCRKSKNSHASTFRHKQRGGMGHETSGKETMPYGASSSIATAASTFSGSKSLKGGRRHSRRKHHSKKHHSKRHHSKRHHSRRKHHSKKHHSRRKHHSKKHHSRRKHHSKKHHSRRRRGGNPAFLLPGVLLAAQKMVQHHASKSKRRGKRRGKGRRRR